MPFNDPEELKAYRRAYYLKNKARLDTQVAKYRKESPEKVAAAKKRCYDRVKEDPEFKAVRSAYGKKRRQKDWGHVREIERRSYFKHRARRLEYQKVNSKGIKRKAREALTNAIHTGKIERATKFKCAKCGNSANEYHHHKGYEKEQWLEVMPICYQCHKDIHFGSHSTWM